MNYVIISVFIFMNAVFLFAVYASFKSINKAHNESVLSRELNELTLNISEEHVIYPIYKDYNKTYAEMRTSQKPFNTLYELTTNRLKDPTLSTSQKWPYDTPHPIPFHNFNAKILHNLSQTS